ncbi:iron ABC transporter ATP-binding protein [Demequina lignilytica]|uniref:ATP-binding cassette domain-containing protein n=1 Tax=Demequina lignilytica TaxID=3051663 RepID=A0AAW7M233_9MICO|nr:MULTISPECIES: ATP-binding cassette domain-containing protein [unclassified Demequina]MDN4478621.1 ATP-binding cassette domain-containing protein [Demequina sp. SYSU T00039-1]MDN4483819.1 ATP-binding cassette domain-containing protein [Demequina sp. SYSU T0a273]MDN4488599.1 ATP-binding cassette domain-containing protein [Demequina sp. SYSU T00039]MDN4491625.1 ATP-binding cassette domain-containing protein [Demequina sp. SYSU T00068]
MITLDSLTKSYDDHLVVDGVSLELPSAGVTSIIGPNGAGKSTLLSMVSRLLGVDAGTVDLDGLDVHRAPSREVARRLAILRQDSHTPARITVRELVELGRHPHSKGRLTPACHAAVDAALARCDLADLDRRGLHELSGGQRQRAYVAMVLAQDTRYLLLDEPLNSLDLVHATALMQLLRTLSDEHGTSVVLVLHDINYASVHSDRIIAMRDGRVVRDGTPEEVITEEALSDVYGAPFRVHHLDGDRIAAYYR